ncbi:MAG TPA: SprT family zinc-dependent metalloprotease [Ktedonobacterales bacterium]|nr:SprT family zinc-dependent metalloprotease [Ktedonobacterales bacterium]
MPENASATSSATSSTHSSGRTSSRRHDTSNATPKTAAVRQRAISLGDATITYRHRVSRRARRLRFEVRPGNGLEVTTPPGVSVARIEAVMREKTDWITKMLVRYAQPPLSVVETPLQSGALLPFAGGQLRLELNTSHPGRRKTAVLEEGTLRLFLDSMSPDAVRAAIERWYRRQAHHVFAERATHWNAQFGYNYGRIAIRDQKSRWGSCSRQGNLNFNWRLLLAPLAVLDYIVIHELAHLKEGNHSPRFWALVAEQCPDYRDYRAWLRQHGPELHF